MRCFYSSVGGHEAHSFSVFTTPYFTWLMSSTDSLGVHDPRARCCRDHCIPGPRRVNLNAGSRAAGQRMPVRQHQEPVDRYGHAPRPLPRDALPHEHVTVT